jgi:hypothetical protein
MSLQMTASLVEAISTPPKPHAQVELIKNYKGTTLSQRGSIVDFNFDTATIQASHRGTFPILEGGIHMRSNEFKGAISATIHPVDYSQGTFRLSNMSYCDWKERKTERVQPKSPTYVTLSYCDGTYRAFLEDISAEGVGILADGSMDPDRKLQIFDIPFLEFQLTPIHTFVNLKGMILYRREVGPDLIKIGLYLYPDAYQKLALADYVVQRHAEIMRELKQDYLRSTSPSRVENLYF